MDTAASSMPHWVNRIDPMRSLVQSPPMRPAKRPSEKAAKANAAMDSSAPTPWSM